MRICSALECTPSPGLTFCLRLSWWMCLMALNSSAWAQYEMTVVEPGREHRQFERVEITGSSVVNPRSREALPVRIVDRKEIERMGVQTVPELVQGLSSMHSFTEAGGTNISGQGGYRSAAIHGYEAGTLVLINGRRLPSFSKQRPNVDRTAADLSMLPLRAIERVEILTDGASSVYGSDAIAGVVNLITLQQAPGLSLTAEKMSTTGTGDGYSTGISWGHGKLDQDGHAATFHLERTQRDPVRMRDRSYTDLHAGVYTLDAQGAPVYYVPQNSFPNTAPAQRLSTSTDATQCPGGLDYSLTRRSGTSWPTPFQCQTSQLRNTYLYPGYSSTNLWSSFEKQIDATLTVFSELGAQQQLSEYQRIVNGRASRVVNGDTLYYDAESFNPGYAREKQNNHRWVVGVRGQWMDWSYTLSHTQAENHFRTTNTGGFTTGSNWATLLTASEWLQDPVSYSDATWAKIQARFAPDTLSQEYRTRLQDTQLQASRTIGENQWGDIKLGTLLFSNQSSLVNSLASNPDIYPLRRTDRGGAIELQLPLYERLEFVSSMRAEKYSDFGSVVTGKMGTKLELGQNTHLRASVGTGFRAPTLAQTSAGNYAIFASTSTTDSYSSGNPDLKPEKSRQWSLGILSQPSLQWLLAMDLWALDVRDVFGVWTQSQIFADPALKDLYYTANYNSAGKARYVFIPFNQGTMAKSGIDYQARYRWPVDLGRMWVGLEGTYNLQSNRSSYPGQAPISDLANYNANTGTVTARHILRLTTSLEARQFGITAQLHYHSGNLEPVPVLVNAQGISQDSDAYPHTVHGHWTLNVSGKYQLTPAVSLRTHISNLTNRTPPVRYSSPYYGTTLADTRYDDYYGRTVRVAMDIRF